MPAAEDETEKDAADDSVEEGGRACRQKGWWKRGDVEKDECIVCLNWRGPTGWALKSANWEAMDFKE